MVALRDARTHDFVLPIGVGTAVQQRNLLRWVGDGRVDVGNGLAILVGIEHIQLLVALFITVEGFVAEGITSCTINRATIFNHVPFALTVEPEVVATLTNVLFGIHRHGREHLFGLPFHIFTEAVADAFLQSESVGIDDGITSGFAFCPTGLTRIEFAHDVELSQAAQDSLLGIGLGQAMAAV